MIRNLKVRTKMICLVLMVVLIGGVIATFSIREQVEAMKESMNTLENTIRKDYDSNIKNQVQAAVSMLKAVEEKQKEGTYTLEEAKKAGADILRNMRYDGENYFWADTTDGECVVLLGGKSEGTNRMDLTDAKGFRMVEAIIKAGENGGGYVDYNFPKPGETKTSPKRAYSLVFKPFQWVIGTGNYTDYIDKVIQDREKSMNEDFQKMLYVFISVILFLLLCAAGLATIIARDIVRPLKIFEVHLDEIAQGNYVNDLPIGMQKRKDDFGSLSRAFQKMKNSTSFLILEVKEQSSLIDQVVSIMKRDVGSLNEEIEGISATTQELAASMEETAASSEEISAVTHEIENAARMIAQKSQDGSLQAFEISKRAEQTKEGTQKSRENAVIMHTTIEAQLRDSLEKAKIVEEITVLSESIMSITAQTNLLALNAAIEAARAGEAGKGFSVVAEEIRHLAEQSKKTVTKIQIITEQVMEAVGELRTGSQRVLNYLEEEVSTDYDRFLEIANQYHDDAGYIDSMVGDFSATSEELLSSIENILGSVQDVALAASEGANGTSEIALKTEEVTGNANDLMDAAKNAHEASEVLKGHMNKFNVK